MSIRVGRWTAGIVLGVMLTSGVALAQSIYVVRAGSECQLYGNGPAGTPVRTSLGAMQNDHATSQVIFMCPLVRWDDAVEPVVRVDYLDNNDNNVVACSVTCRDFDGETASVSTTEISSQGGTGYGYLTIDDTGYQDGRCYLNCQLPDTDTPGASQIVSYVESWYPPP